MTHRDKKTGWSPAAAAATAFFGCVTADPGLAQDGSHSDGPIACANFQRGPNGFWTVLRPTTISPQVMQLSLAARQTFAKNQFVNGTEVTTVLDRNCGRRR